MARFCQGSHGRTKFAFVHMTPRLHISAVPSFDLLVCPGRVVAARQREVKMSRKENGEKLSSVSS
ncbi:hypothetical protein E2C01_090663 [Portunus trituberculatus]|uniref:Uncharacterized protein n=1 Tax=Portunus trituberculatus TaxID=210409 RepID=A0A5B7JBX1_PORTR|nr:hypothetical protein [Portunus trituberculatus]